MDDRIRVLPNTLIDQIAAGEVVERPASVVKELLENALDAHSGSITVETAQGGAELIRVSDDGDGMSRTDAMMALRRHATSKIRTLEDLHSIQTLGFRGEALPSIASVCHFTLTTRTHDALEGTKVSVDGGSDPVVRDAGCGPGTTIEVRELFYNVPARRKFLKSQGTESALIAEVCMRTALLRPELRLVVLRDGKRVREYLPSPDVAERARSVLTDDTLADIHASREGVTVRALLGPPEKARSGAAGLHIFVNGRAVRDRALARAVAFAYGSVLPPGRYPNGALFIDMTPGEVDVNVHPQKAEVRFARGNSVLDIVTRLLATRLGATPYRGPLTRPPTYWSERVPAPGSGRPEEQHSSAPPTLLRETTSDPWGLAAAVRDSKPASDQPQGAPPQSERPQTTASENRLIQTRGFFGELRLLGQAQRMFIVCEGPRGLMVLDQHAADERVRYHRLRAAYRARDVRTQRLLFPERVECTPVEAEVIEETHDELLAIGLDCSLAGPTTIAIQAIPALVGRASPERLLRDALGELTKTGERSFGDAIDTAIATMACHGSIRGGDALSLQECAALLTSLDEIDEFQGHCPHGRPVVYEISFAELERRLGR